MRTALTRTSTTKTPHSRATFRVDRIDRVHRNIEDANELIPVTAAQSATGASQGNAKVKSKTTRGKLGHISGSGPVDMG